MKTLTLTIAALAFAAAFAACENAKEPGENVRGSERPVSDANGSAPSSDDPARSESNMIAFDGVVVHKDIEGGFYAIESTEGEKYDPVNLPESFREDGLPVRVSARPKPDAMSIRMYGTLIEIIEISER